MLLSSLNSVSCHPDHFDHGGAEVFEPSFMPALTFDLHPRVEAHRIKVSIIDHFQPEVRVFLRQPSSQCSKTFLHRYNRSYICGQPFVSSSSV